MIVGLDVADGAVTVAVRELDGRQTIHDGRGALDELAAGGRVRAVAAAVADHWLDGARDGARHLEQLHHDVVERLRLPLRSVVRRSQATAARYADGGADLILVLEPTPELATAALYQVESAQVRPLGAAGRRVADDTGPVRQALGEAVAQADAAAHARAASVLPRCRHSRYRGTPLYSRSGTGRYTAGEVLEWYAGIEAALTDSVARALPATAPTGTVQVVTTGPLRDFPPLAHPAQVGGRPLPAALAAAPRDCAAGALLLAEESVRAVEQPARFAVRLPTSRVWAGRLRSESVPLHTPTGQPNLAVGWDGHELAVDVDATRQLTVDVHDTDPAAVTSAWTVTLQPRPAPGRYRLGLWAGRFGPGVLVLRPADGAEPQLFPLSQ
ncbi:hypothetical protein [Catellatospora sp. TT07R-123]|uniref:hypothetical protein n=1 Tax=Catellatospora sp. TT07R-123 TaxID=2733863 RepID=UPI001BB374B0|nr:hypothetical protein [Catellatospora sp. TT07R-123]